MSNLHVKTLVAAVTASLLVAAGAASAQIVGGGATLPENLYNGPGPNYDTGIITEDPDFAKYIGVGSGNGKRAFFNNDRSYFGLAAGPTVHYAGSDSLITKAEREAYDAHTSKGKSSFGALIQVPAVLTSVTVPFNIPGQTELKLTSEQLAGIFKGTITQWSQVIPGGPAQDIKVVFRAGSSGTTEIFLRHIATTTVGVPNGVNSSFSAAYGFTDATPPANFILATGSAGVASTVANTPYSISYVSPEAVAYEDATKVAKLEGINPVTNVSDYLLPNQDNVKAAAASLPTPVAANLTLDHAENWGIGYSLPGTPSPLANPDKGYPIVGVTNLLFSQCYADNYTANAIRGFLNALYSGTYDTSITAGSFISLPTNWANDSKNTFVTVTSPHAINNTSVCAGYTGR